MSETGQVFRLNAQSEVDRLINDSLAAWWEQSSDSDQEEFYRRYTFPDSQPTLGDWVDAAVGKLNQGDETSRNQAVNLRAAHLVHYLAPYSHYGLNGDNRWTYNLAVIDPFWANVDQKAEEQLIATAWEVYKQILVPAPRNEAIISLGDMPVWDEANHRYTNPQKAEIVHDFGSMAGINYWRTASYSGSLAVHVCYYAADYNQVAT